jgi:hypothetical protein
MVLLIFATAAALPRFFVLAQVLVAGGASALVLDLVLAVGEVAFVDDCASATLRCLRFFRLNVLVLVVGLLVSVSVGRENVFANFWLANLSDCAINRVIRWAGSVPCTLGTVWVFVGCVVRTLGIAGVVLSVVAIELVIVGC